MRSLAPLGVLGLVVFASSCADAATITGTVKGPDGAPFRAAFVQARHAGLKMTVSVLPTIRANTSSRTCRPATQPRNPGDRLRRRCQERH